MELAKAYSIKDLQKQRFKTFDFKHKFLESFGRPEANGVWLIWGKSGNGKTSMSLQLAKYFAEFTKVYYNTLEEGARLSFLNALEGIQMESVGSRFQFQRENYDTMVARLSRKRSAKIVFIDSLQYLRININKYIALREMFPDKVFVFVSHAKNDQPKGALADEIMYDADVKIFIKDFVGQVHSRFGGNKPYVIWEEGMKNKTAKLV